MGKNYHWIGVYCFFTLACILVRWDAFFLPFYHDELGFYGPLTKSLLDQSFQLTSKRVPLIPYHPPLMNYWTALFAYLGGWNLFSIRLSIFPIGGLFLTLTFALMRFRLETSSALLCALSLLFTPVVLSEVGLLQPDLISATLLTLALYLLLQGKERSSSITLLFAALANAPVAGVFPGLAAYFFFSLPKGNQRLPLWIKQCFRYFLPATLALLLWYAFYIWAEGRVGNPRPDPHGVDLAYRRGLDVLFKRLVFHRPVQMLLWDGRFLVTLSGGIALGVALYRKRSLLTFSQVSRPYLLPACLILSEWIFLCVFGSTHQRYFLHILPLLYAFSAWAWAGVFSKLNLLTALPFVASAFIGILLWHGPSIRYAPTEYRSEYRDHVELHQEVAQFLSKTSARRVETEGALALILPHPDLLYGNRVIDVHTPQQNALPSDYRAVFWENSAPQLAKNCTRFRRKRFGIDLCQTKY